MAGLTETFRDPLGLRVSALAVNSILVCRIPTPKDSDFIGLSCHLGVRMLSSSLGDANV